MSDDELYAFVLDFIDTVPHLEALLLLWNSRPRVWDESDLAARLYVNSGGARSIMADLERRGLVTIQTEPQNAYLYRSSPDHDRLVEALAVAYRTDLIRISTTIHGKGSPGVREFARAFEFKRKEKKP